MYFKYDHGNSVNVTTFIPAFLIHQDTTNHDEPKPSAPPDVAKVYVKVDWLDEIPKRWKNHLQIALQTWCNSELKEKCSVNEVQLVGDERTAEVEITPSTGDKLHLFILVAILKIESKLLDL